MKTLPLLLITTALLLLQGCSNGPSHGVHDSVYLESPTMEIGGTLIVNAEGLIAHDSLVLWKHTPLDPVRGRGVIVVGMGSIDPDLRQFTLDAATERYTYRSRGRISLWYYAGGHTEPVTEVRSYIGTGYDDWVVVPYDYREDPQVGLMTRYLPPFGSIAVPYFDGGGVRLRTEY